MVNDHLLSFSNNLVIICRFVNLNKVIFFQMFLIRIRVYMGVSVIVT